MDSSVPVDSSVPEPVDRGGRRPSHGAYLLARLYAANQLDSEGQVATALRQSEDAILADRGGASNVPVMQQELIRRYTFLSLFCGLIEGAFEKALERGEWPQAPSKHYFTACNAAQRIAVAIGLDRVEGERLPSLQDYIRQFDARQQQARNGSQDAQTHVQNAQQPATGTIEASGNGEAAPVCADASEAGNR